MTCSLAADSPIVFYNLEQILIDQRDHQLIWTSAHPRDKGEKNVTPYILISRYKSGFLSNLLLLGAQTLAFRKFTTSGREWMAEMRKINTSEEITSQV